MNDELRIQARFDLEARRFDAIYSGQQGLFGRLWDRLTRQNVWWRLRFTLDAVRPIRGLRVLDVGCGSGRYTVALAEQGAAEVQAIDLSPRMLELARRLAACRGVEQRCWFHQIGALEYQGEWPFDVTVAAGFFDYIRNPLEVLRHLRRQTEGKLVASFPAKWSIRAPVRKMWRQSQGCYVGFYDRNDVTRLCSEAGFEPLEVVRHGPIYMLVASSRTVALDGRATK